MTTTPGDVPPARAPVDGAAPPAPAPADGVTAATVGATRPTPTRAVAPPARAATGDAAQPAAAGGVTERVPAPVGGATQPTPTRAAAPPAQAATGDAAERAAGRATAGAAERVPAPVGGATQPTPAGGRGGLTASGVGVAVGGAVLLGTGYAGGYPALASLGVAALSAVLLALAWTTRRPSLKAARTVTPDRVTVGEVATARLTVTNTGRMLSPTFDALDAAQSHSGTSVAGRVQVPVLRPGNAVSLDYPIVTVQRGLLRLGPVTLERTDPLGLARRRAPLTGTALLWVHPRVHPVRPLPVGLTLDFDGRLAERAGSTAFSSLREYQPGDDPRSVHWRSTARIGSLVVRERVDTREPSVSVVIDTRATEFTAEAFEHAVEFAASVCVAFRRAGRPVSLSAVDEPELLSPDLMDRLATLGRSTATAGPAQLLGLIDRSQDGGLLIVVTGDSPGIADAVATRRRRFSGAVVARFDPELPEVLTRRTGIELLTAATAESAARLFNTLATP